jgi:glycosyltransferase involved in cell wall biosynthesis
MEKISVIMPCFNASAHLERGLESVLGQSYENIELIAVDDGSTDSTPGMLKAVRDSRVKVVTQANSGVGAARNRGLREAKGAYIAFLDADDSWDMTCLEKLHGVLEGDPEAVLSYCGWQNVGLKGGQGRPYVPPDYEKEDKTLLMLTSCPWPIHAALTRKGAIEAAGGFDERFRNAEDYGLWLRVAQAKIRLVPEVLAFYHFHGGAQATKDRARAAREHWLVQREFLDARPEVTNRLGRPLVRKLTDGELLKKGYICYWDRDLEAAREIFMAVMKTGYGTLRDWKYMLPSVLPLNVHRFMVRTLQKREKRL